MTRLAFTGPNLFTGERFVDGHGLLVDGGRILGLAPLGEIPSDVARQDLGPGLLVPGFVDAQVNGGGGVLFNDTPDAAALSRLALAHARYGTTAMMPTFITDRADGMRAAVDAVRAAVAAGAKGIAGIHLEGPFLSLARKGAHDPALIRPMSEDDMALVTGSGPDHVLITVAPETVPPHQIRRLADAGVIVSLGHTDATYEAAMAAADAGARGVTHLYNAMSQLQHRAPGVVGAALDHGGLWCGIIADGHHVHPAALANAIRAKKGPAKLFLVTDAMPTAGDAADTFRLNGRLVTRRDGLLTLEDGTLAGSDLTMDAALRFSIERLDVSLDEGLRMASLYPAMLLGLDSERGRLASGYRADLVLLDPLLAVRGVWIGGERL